jgi:dipeptidyl aminopeptidase/acylaminoacyl peptidase
MKKHFIKHLIGLITIFFIVFTGCSPAPSTINPVLETATTAAIGAPTLAATEAPTLIPTIAFTPTPVPHPMSIQALRNGIYPGSDIVIEKELDRGANYRRFYAYYLSEGLKIYALLTVPDGEPPAGGWPAIVFNHGYIPPDVYKTTERYIAYVDLIACSEYIVFRIDYRGHDNSEGTASGAYSNPGYEVDVLNAVASIKKFPQADPERIGMWGHSMGGFLTLRAMVVSPDIKVGVIWAGVVGSYPDMLYNWRRNNPGVTPSPSSTSRSWRRGWIDLYGSPEENPEFWNSISANSYLSDLSGPIQLHHGTADHDVPLMFSEKLWQQIIDANGYVELYKYDGDNHNISNYFSLAMSRTIEFFDRYLKYSNQ